MDRKENEYGYYIGLVMKSGIGMDHTAAILLTAELERLLNMILKEYFLPNRRNIRDILSPEGSCGALYAQIELAYRLGIITEVIAHDLHIVREIRNRFAHGTHEMSFESEELKNKLPQQQVIEIITSAVVIEKDFVLMETSFRN